jgi:hypothetical protein
MSGIASAQQTERKQTTTVRKFKPKFDLKGDGAQRQMPTANATAQDSVGIAKLEALVTDINRAKELASYNARIKDESRDY